LPSLAEKSQSAYCQARATLSMRLRLRLRHLQHRTPVNSGLVTKESPQVGSSGPFPSPVSKPVNSGPVTIESPQFISSRAVSIATTSIAHGI
ncbi:hypothetical protein J3459_003816, partial [Metarhizium acridum]